MANKRMFTLKVVDSDVFLEMPLSTQCLYFHLAMRADDDGFVGNPMKILRITNASKDDLKLLIAKRFLLTFPDDTEGVMVIKHWRMHNCISQNRYHETQYIDQKSQLRLRRNNTYSLTEGVPIDDRSLIESQAEEKAISVSERKDSSKGKTEYSLQFKEMWEIYPKKRDKGQAYRQYQARIRDGYTAEEILTAVQNYADECRRTHRDEKYIKHAKTFLGAATPFEDYLPGKNDYAPAQRNEGAADFDKYLQ